MTNEQSFTILRYAYDETYLHDLNDEDVQTYYNIGNNMMLEATRELSRRQKKEK